MKHMTQAAGAALTVVLSIWATAALAQSKVPAERNVAASQKFTTDIARAQLSKAGTTEPTAEQLAASSSNVQAMRDGGMGWGAIANALGLRFGEVVSATNRERHNEVESAKARGGQGAGGKGNGGGRGGGGGNGGGRR